VVYARCAHALALTGAKAWPFRLLPTDSLLEESGFELLVPPTTEKTLCDTLEVQKRKYSRASAALMLAFTESAEMLRQASTAPSMAPKRPDRNRPAPTV
jgi:hypothetical protein